MAVNFDGPPGSTPLDPDELEGLKPGHIIRRSELDEWEGGGGCDAEPGADSAKSTRDAAETLTPSFKGVRSQPKVLFPDS